MKIIRKFLVGVVLGSGAILTFFPEFVSEVSLETRITAGLVIAGMVLITYIPFSYVLRKIKIFFLKLKRIRIGLAIVEDISLNEGIVKFCNEEINNLGLSSKIVFEAYKLKKNPQKNFEKIVLSSNTDVIVWKNDKKSTQSKVVLSFTHKDTIDRLIGQIVRSELYSVVSREKMFDLNKKTFALNLSLEKNNIADFSLYIVAVCTTFFRGLDEGIFVFESLKKKIEFKKGILKEKTDERLKGLYVVKGKDLLYKKKYLKGVEMVEKAYSLDSLDANVLELLTLGKFIIGKEEEAEKHSVELLQNHTGLPVAHLDAAFFRIRNGKYVSALKQYYLYYRSKPDPAISLEAIEFLTHQLEKNSANIAYLFARAYLKKIINTKPEKIGGSTYVEDAQVFIDKTSGEFDRYKELIEYAKKHWIINNIFVS